jgi:ribonuclease PH
VALALAIKHLVSRGKVKENAIPAHVAAISVGLIDGVPTLDLDYGMDSRAEVDMNVVMTGKGDFVEVQGTGEGHTFKRAELGALPSLVEIQKRAIGAPRTEKPVAVTL